jgi:hypothetical protein
MPLHLRKRPARIRWLNTVPPTTKFLEEMTDVHLLLSFVLQVLE